MTVNVRRPITTHHTIGCRQPPWRAEVSTVEVRFRHRTGTDLPGIGFRVVATDSDRRNVEVLLHAQSPATIDVRTVVRNTVLADPSAKICVETTCPLVDPNESDVSVTFEPWE